ncbi:hypothetical protein NPJ82_02640 [Sphingomonas sp. NY01]|uniref:hypothetical protein n=1 Tax=Sphingomonas sp. NY01 TaxID=2968057 RepID=UPI00315C7ABB
MIGTVLVALATIQNINPTPTQPTTYETLMASRVPVTTEDITDRPYRVVKHVKRNVRKATLLSGNPSRTKLENELWERGRAAEADAVVNARYIDDGVWARAQGASFVEGDAVKFLTSEEVQALRGLTPSTK